MGVFRALAGVGLAVIVAGASGCTLDKSGLDFLPINIGRDAAGTDSGDDVVIDPVDAAADGTVADAGVDSEVDSNGGAPDAGAETRPDTRPDVRPDVVTPDVGADHGVDARPDVVPDVAPDVGPDLAPDLAPDVVQDVRPPTDVAGDLPPDTRPVCTTSCEAGAVTVNSATGGGRYTGTTAGVSSSVGSCGGSDAPESVFHVVLTAPSDLFVTTHGTRFDTVIYLRNGCCGTELACNDNIDGRRTSVLSATGLAAGSYDVFVDGATAADLGPFTVDVFVSPASPNPGDTCGRPAHIASAALTGTTCGMRDDTRPLNGCQATENPGSDVVYYFVLDEPATVSFNTCTGTCMDSVIYLRDVCTDTTTQLTCDDDSCVGCSTSPLAQQSRVTRALTAGAHYLVVDTLGGTACGAFTVTPVNVPQ